MKASEWVNSFLVNIGANPGVLRETASRPGALGSSNHNSLSCAGGGVGWDNMITFIDRNFLARNPFVWGGGGGVGQYDNVH